MIGAALSASTLADVRANVRSEDAVPVGGRRRAQKNVWTSENGSAKLSAYGFVIAFFRLPFQSVQNDFRRRRTVRMKKSLFRILPAAAIALTFVGGAAQGAESEVSMENYQLSDGANCFLVPLRAAHRYQDLRRLFFCTSLKN